MSEEPCAWMRRFIADRHWQFAKSMPQIPHEYTVKKWHPDGQAFEQAVQLIRDHGEPRWFGNRRFIYLHVDGYRYWTMGADVLDTVVINRCPDE